MASRGVVGLTTQPASRISSSKGQHGGLVFYWFRLGDLRLHDNPGLERAAAYCRETHGNLIPLFCFDPRIFGAAAITEFGSMKCAPRRAKFVIESVDDLKRSLEKRGSKLLISSEKPEELFSRILKDASSETPIKIIYQQEVCSEEMKVAANVEKLFKSSEAVWGSTLYDLKDLPYDDSLEDMPNGFTAFRNKVEKNCSVRGPLPIPKDLNTISNNQDVTSMIDQYSIELPSLQDLGYTLDQIDHANFQDARGVMTFRGGETAGLARVKEYIWDKDLLKTYFDSRNGMLGSDYSSKLSPWLAHGNISPRYLARECKKYEETRVANKSTYWLVFEVLWRDYFKYFAKKHGDKIFSPGGTEGSSKEWKHYEKNLQAWKDGKTGFPLVDANMRELAATGFMSNRGRQNVCSFLALELNLDWRYGADYFESVLLDHDVHSNWGNWCAGAGMTGGRINKFNIVKQSKDYDQHGEYVRHWLPELKDVPTKIIHEPWKMSQFQQIESNCRLGVDYPNPIAKPYYPNPKNSGRSKGDNSKSSPNNNRGRGQRKDMKSMKKGSYDIIGYT